MNNIEFKFNKKSQSILVWLISILAIVYLICVISLLIVAVKAIVLYSTKLLVPAIIIIAMCIVALLYTLDIVLWQIIGKEHIEITNNEIKLHQFGRIFNKKKTIEIDSIKSITKRIYSLKGINHYWFPSKQGSIKIEYNNKTISVGRNISEKEIDTLINTIQRNATTNITVSIKNEIRDYSGNEIMFYIFIVFSIFVGLPAYIWVPFTEDYKKLERDVRLSFLEENFPKKYCYASVACWDAADANILEFSDSIHLNLYYKQCDISDAEAYEICADSSIKYYTPKRIMPSSKGRFLYRGVIYVVNRQDSLSLVYSNENLYDLFWVHTRYVHDSIPETINEFDRKLFFGF
jgi:hypothetical protein